mgnify:CR=1 FL=1
MKEASGEANLTVVAIILIGVIAAFVTPLIKSTMENTKKRTECLNNGGNWDPANGCDIKPKTGE